MICFVLLGRVRAQGLRFALGLHTTSETRIVLKKAQAAFENRTSLVRISGFELRFDPNSTPENCNVLYGTS